MRRSFSYIGLLLATVTGLFIAGNEPVSQVNNRIIAVHVSKEKDFSSTAPEVRAGSIDLLVDEGTSLHLLGWVSPFVDEIIMIPRAKAPNYVSRIGLSSRSDVANTLGKEEYLWSGVDILVPDTSLASMSCIVYSGSSGATVLWSDGSPCAGKMKKPEPKGFDFSVLEDSPQ
jgi:hypothetical protein